MGSIKDLQITNIINKFLEKADPFGGGFSAGQNQSQNLSQRHIKGTSGYVPVQVLVHRKDGSVIPSIRWKSFKQEKLTNVKSNKNLPAVRNVGETPAFTRFSSIKQTMFFLADEMDIDGLHNGDFLPITEYEFLGKGVYLYSKIETAQERAEELGRGVLPVKVDIEKVFSTQLNAIRTQNLENIKTQGYSAIVLMKDTIYEFDLFCFDTRDIVVIGEDDNLTEDIQKSIEDYELQDAESTVSKEYLDTLKCIPYSEPDSEIEKARPKAPPLKEDGTVDYDKVAPGESIWVTVTQEDSPLKGRPIIITKKPDGLFALTGGSGFDAQGERSGIKTRADAMRHLVMTGKPKKTKADEELDIEQEETEKRNEPLIRQSKDLMEESKRQLGDVYHKLNEAMNIKESDRVTIKKHRDEFVQLALDAGVDENIAKNFATSIVKHWTRSDRQIEELKRREIGFKVNKLSKMGEITEEDLQKLNEELAFDSITVDLPTPKSLEGLTPEQIDDKIGDIFDEKVSKIFNPNPLDKSINAELKAEGIEINPADKDPNIPQVEIGANVKPIGIKDIGQLSNTIGAYENYYGTKRKYDEVKGKIRRINLAKTTPAMIEQMRMEVRGVLGEHITDAEIENNQKSYENQYNYNNSALSFYKAVGEFWNDENSLRYKLDRIDNSFGGYVNSGANSALAAITGANLDERIDVSQLIEKTSIETACLVTAFNLRDRFEKDPAKYDLLIKRVEEYNSKNQIEAEQRALKRHSDLKQRYETIQEAKRTSLLVAREGDENYKLKTEMVAGEIENLVEQKNNIGSALGSMQTSAAILHALTVARDSKDDAVVLNFGADKKGADLRLRELNLPLSKAYLDDTDPNNIQIRSTARNLIKFSKTLEVTKDIHDENEKIKSDTSDTYTDEDGNTMVNNYEVPLWKDTYKKEVLKRDENGKEYTEIVDEPYKHRVEQRNDIEFLKKMGSGLITRVTGAGKTNTALGFFANKITDNKNYSGLVVVPKGREDQWMDEAKRFSDLNIVKLSSKKEERIEQIRNIEPGQVVLTTQPDATTSYLDLESAFSRGKIKGLVLDEPQEIASKSISGNMSAKTRKLMKLPSENRIALTATPARDNLIEAYDLVNWVSHNDRRLGPRTRFQRTYGGYGSGTNAQDVALAEMIYKEISPYMSGDRLTNPTFKVKQNEVIVKKTDLQNKNMKAIEGTSREFIKNEVDKAINTILSDPKKLSRQENSRFGKGWKSQVARKAREKAKEAIVRQHADNLSGIIDNMTWQDNPKINNAIERIVSNRDGKHVIFVDNNKQRMAIKEGLIAYEFSPNHIKNIASSLTSMSGAKMAEQVKEFRTNKDVKIIFIDKNSASGYNLQEGNDLHILGTPSDAANYMQAQGRLARMPRKGDVNVHTYKYSDDPFEDTRWTKMENQLAILRATAPGLMQEQ